MFYNDVRIIPVSVLLIKENQYQFYNEKKSGWSDIWKHINHACMQPLPREWHNTSLDKTDFWRHNYPLSLLSHKTPIIYSAKIQTQPVFQTVIFMCARLPELSTYILTSQVQDFTPLIKGINFFIHGKFMKRRSEISMIKLIFCSHLHPRKPNFNVLHQY